ncbi:MAG: hypothetical protein AAB792_01665 [Patescibacteria group bacterium]
MNTNYPILKSYWFWVIAVLVVGTLFFYLPAPGSNEPARLTIRFDDGRARAFEGPVEEDTTVLQALISASSGGDFDLRYSLDEGNNVNLASIDGAFGGTKKWHFYLNGQSVRTEDISRIKIKKGDSIEAKYE